MKKAQISIIEGTLMILLFGFFISSFALYSQETSYSYDSKLETISNTIYFSQDYRDIIINEDLNSSTLTQNWTPMFSALNKSLGNYQIVLLNKTASKNIKTCDANIAKEFDERIIVAHNNSYEFRKLRIGACY